jgi:hypothetical protein
MSSLRRVLSSRANGALARGPVTPEGKERSARNAIRHGLLARCIVLDDESPEGFDALLADCIDRLRPVGGMELGIVEDLAATCWRIRRSWALETRLLDKEIAAQPEGDPLDRMADAFASLSRAPSLALLHRYETRLHLAYQRALHNILLLRAADIPNEPSPISEQNLCSSV